MTEADFKKEKLRQSIINVSKDNGWLRTQMQKKENYKGIVSDLPCQKLDVVSLYIDLDNIENMRCIDDIAITHIPFTFYSYSFQVEFENTSGYFVVISGDQYFECTMKKHRLIYTGTSDCTMYPVEDETQERFYKIKFLSVKVIPLPE